ncbi:MAG: hypothetical protein JSS76_16575 [Bacteroidetes bacterium]|nr:hypothetical protein [Bacteroidota bacterium]
MPVRFIYTNDRVKIHWDIHLAYTTSAIGMAAILATPYLIWECYWAWHAGYACVKWHTHLAFYFYVWLAISLVLEILMRHPISWQLAAAAVCGGMLLAEGALMLAGIGATYSERLGHGYSSIHSASGESYYRTRAPGSVVWFDGPEFRHARHVNSMGYSDREWQLAKQPYEKRILCLGDSWTEGVGAPQDSTYVSQLGSMLAETDSHTYIMNAGIAADDPFVNYVNYRDRLIAYHPDVIIQTLSGNDMTTDIISKGGMERFGTNGQLHPSAGPVWEPLYAVSLVARLVFHAAGYNALLQKAPSPEKIGELNDKIVNLFREYAALAARQGTLLIVVIQATDHDYDFAPVIARLQQIRGLRICDLQQSYNAELTTSGNKSEKYYWPVDGHHTPLGYQLMARSIYNALDSFYLRPRVVRDPTR